MFLNSKPKVGLPEKLGRIATVAVFVLLLLFLLPLACRSLWDTATIDTNNSVIERTGFEADFLLFNLLALLLGIAILYLVRRLLRDVGFVPLLCFVLAVVGALCVFYLVSAASLPSADSYSVSHAAKQAVLGNYEPIGGVYFVYYPFQLGYVLFAEVLIQIFRPFGSVDWYSGLLQGANVLFLLLAYAAVADTVRRLFGEDAGKICLVLCLLCLQPVPFSAFIYGNVPAFSLAVCAVWCWVRFSKSKNGWFAVGAALLFGLATMLKMNCLIFTVAAALVSVVRALQTRRAGFLLMGLGIVVSSIFFQEFPLWIYTARTGIAFGDGIPISAWLAMGMHETVRGNGWYDHSTVTIFTSTGYDSAATSAIAMEDLRQRISVFLENPAYCQQFFTDKFLSQWNETSYQAIWNTQVRPHAYEMHTLAKWVCGDGEGAVKAYFDLYTQNLFWFSVLGCGYLLWKRRDEGDMCLYPLALFGGMLYHLFWEAKSQYALTYLFLFLPLAAVGLFALFRLLDGAIPRAVAHLTKEGAE